ncbi:carbohydrate porin [Paraburkholderia sp. J67]|uniref:carbohydrate porin n=1 Tax=Paraburkholderia sp. J67 TaxID=2805435 RepID=UPI002ABD4E75|nr:carbohydrate porin [Paraburkholderia sp. J67]
MRLLTKAVLCSLMGAAMLPALTEAQTSTTAASDPEGTLAQLPVNAIGSPPSPLSPPLAPSPPAGFNGPLSSVGQALDNHGIDLGLVFLSPYVNSLSTGTSPGHSAIFGGLNFVAKVDLEKAVGIPNTTINFHEVLNQPSYNTDKYLLQTAAAYQPFPVQTNNADLVRFTLSHDFFDKRLHVEYGRMNTSQDFLVGTMCSQCLMGALSMTVFTPGLTKSVWGAHTTFDLTPQWHLGLGIVEDNMANWQNHSGWDWSTSTRTGWIIFANAMYEDTFADTRYPAKAEFGLFRNTSPYKDPLYNTDGSSQALNSTGDPLMHTSGNWGLYAQGRKVVWRESGGGPVPRNLAVYGGALVAPPSYNAYPLEAYTGVEYGGFFDNPVALVGSTLRWIHLSGDRALYETESRQAYTTMLNAMSGGAVPISTEPTHRDNFAIDVHTQYGILPGVMVGASAQYVIHPNQVIPLPATTPQRSGWIVGAFLLVDLGRLAGLSK